MTGFLLHLFLFFSVIFCAFGIYYLNEEFIYNKNGVPDPDPPDPHVLGPPDPDPDPLIRCMDPYQGSGYRSFYLQAKIVRKTLIIMFCDFFWTFIFEK
jgi:hypothetical protein